jgi:hypothetical protein
MTLLQALTATPLIASLAVPLTSAVPDEPSRTRVRCMDCNECAEAPHVRVVSLNLYNQSRLGQASLATVVETAKRIWMPYGISVEAGTTRNGIAIILSGRSSPDPETGPPILGTTLFSDGHATPYIHLWLGAAEALASTTTALGGRPFEYRVRDEREQILAQMMGVALAHELGHYLLDTNRHSREGLLQTGLRVHDMAFPDPAILTLTVEQQRLLCSSRVK